jgi:hypothetical protein
MTKDQETQQAGRNPFEGMTCAEMMKMMSQCAEGCCGFGSSSFGPDDTSEKRTKASSESSPEEMMKCCSAMMREMMAGCLDKGDARTNSQEQ